MSRVSSEKTNGFNPRICKRCDGLEVQLTKAQAVSIHASVKDATAPLVGLTTYETVSIHASVKDATRKDEILSNPSLVSIHASVKDATYETTFRISVP